MVKGQNEKTTNKSFYIWMLAGALAIICICAVCLNIRNLNDKEKDKSIHNSIAEHEVETPAPAKDVASIGDAQISSRKVTDEVNLLENDIVDDGAKNTVKETAKPSKKPEAVSVMSNGNAVLNSLKFDEEAGLAWPVSGNVILNYSDSNTIYFPTLACYKCNPAIIISADEGAKVKSAAKGVVTNIFENEETGKTIQMSIGGDYTLTYGQLKDLTVKKGDVVKEGQVIASIAKPSKYYVEEGDNLYFKVEQKDKTVNPMYLLK
jgi:murein DD-endopeptidase MepM/ murein hydrolase activator NlpD